MINTGWVNGDFKTGYRIDMEKTRKTIDMIQNGKVANLLTRNEPFFDFEIPTFEHLTKEENFPSVVKGWEHKACDLLHKFNE
jgi:ATP-dependent phosphoenolpyruvate carboxykinase